MDLADRVIEQTAAKISRALDEIMRDLPETAPQMAIEMVMRRLEVTQPSVMRLILDDYDIRESYFAAVARRPATARL